MAKGSLSPALFLAVFLFFSEAVAATAENETDKVTASVITSSEKVNPTQDIDVLIRLQMHDDWHTYWSNPGDAGLSTQVKWQLPEGYVVEEPVLSRPQKFMFDGLVQYGYGDVAYLRTKIKPQPESLPEGSRKYFSAVVSWLACKDVCVPETVKLNFMLPVTNRLTEISQEWAAEAAAAKPRFSYRPDWKALYEVKDGNRLLINIDSRGFDFAENVKKILFIPHQKDIIVNTAEQTAGYDGNGRLSLEIPLENGDFDELSGVLLLEYADGDTGYELTLEAGKNLDVYEPIDYDTRGLWLIMLMAFAGGLILNLMPCIFPILTIKVISLAQSPYNKYKARVESRRANFFQKTEDKRVYDRFFCRAYSQPLHRAVYGNSHRLYVSQADLRLLSGFSGSERRLCPALCFGWTVSEVHTSFSSQAGKVDGHFEKNLCNSGFSDHYVAVLGTFQPDRS